MASISGLSSSSSIYGTRNIISGLASGMDTEAMIENAVSGYKLKITNLTQKRTKIGWQQEAYRSIINKMSAFTNKYTSYTSSTNLMSASFFNSAVKVSTQGKYKDLVAASGNTSSNVQITSVKQLAKAASYTVSGIGTSTGKDGAPAIRGKALNLSEPMELSTVSGSLTINDGNSRSISISFDKDKIYKSAEELYDDIVAKLDEQKITKTDGSVVNASDIITVEKVTDAGGKVTGVKFSGNNNTYISSVSGDIAGTLGISTGDGEDTIDFSGKAFYETKSREEYLKNEEISFTVDGVTKKIKVGDISAAAGSNDAEKVASVLNQKLEDAFGSGKVTVTAENGALSIATQKGSTMSISGGKALGLDSDMETTYVNTDKTLKDLLTLTDDMRAKNEDGSLKFDANGKALYELKINDVSIGEYTADTALEEIINDINGNTDAGVKLSYSKTTNQFQFTAKESGESSRVEMNGPLAEALFGAGGGRTVKEEAGQDAIFSMTVNGQELNDITRSSNTFEVDGLTVNLKGTFGYETDDKGRYLAATDASGNILDANGNTITGSGGNLVTTTMGTTLDAEGYLLKEDGTRFKDAAGKEIQAGFVKAADAEAVTFQSTSDTDKIVEAVKAMVEDYNAMVTEIKEAYSTLPAQKSNGTYYEPLTDEDKEGMSESTIEDYEEMAKQGLLFGDHDLSSLYNRLRDAVSMTGQDGADLAAAGISISYSNGLTTLSLDENKLRSTLETDPERVKDIFTKSKEHGSSTNGLMQALKTPLDMYGQTTGTKGILVEKAGSILSPTSIYQNTIQRQLDDIDSQIEKWEEKLSDQIDRYTAKFTQLEQLVAQMNSQSSALAGLMGGY